MAGNGRYKPKGNRKTVRSSLEILQNSADVERHQCGLIDYGVGFPDLACPQRMGLLLPIRPKLRRSAPPIL